MRRFGAFALVTAVSTAAASQASAQVAGIPFYASPRGGTGVSVAANAGSTDENAGGGKGIAVTGGVGVGPLRLTATAGQFNPTPAGDNVNTFGATAGMRLFGAPLVPISIGVTAGVGYAKYGTALGTQARVSVPVAVGIGINIPLFPIKPWVAPRVQFNRSAAVGTTPSSTETRVGVSVGADFNLLLGLGVHAAVDYLPKKVDGATTLPSSTTIGVGAHFNFNVPMM